MSDVLTPADVETMFTRSDGGYLFARWGRPLAPVVFGVEDATLSVIRAAFEAVCHLAGHQMAETDPELGANVMVFFCRDWDELAEVPNLDRLVPDMGPLVTRLQAASANQYRIFRFDDAGAIRACFIFLRMDAEMVAVPADTLALGQAVQALLLWSDQAFGTRSPLGQLADGRVVVRPEVGAVLRAAYEPVMPVAARDPSHALRLAARIGLAG
ncbi:hypothetical protein [Puniceibacterium sp. IMCC21224]|uniref:hypothetical protein n=1 Tax=Puniceibacterium sp. IMCC21224 TaxID=1618204 RepID=UPI00065D4102|nr:hypothetical protein [Puniceibacterium sp. IMCC21224]KMK68136.1 hypothetical protein IMCC21224_113016 [Puniceibacterium sp. IMCC21224]